MDRASLRLFRELRGTERDPVLALLASGLAGAQVAESVGRERVFAVTDTAGDSNAVLAGAVVLEIDDATVKLHAFVVDPCHRRMGIGGHLIASLADRCRADGVRRIVAWVRSAEAGGFLTSCGFVATPNAECVAVDCVSLQLRL
jgi:GNAT superfamily N-acetyltransferase